MSINDLWASLLTMLHCTMVCQLLLIIAKHYKTWFTRLLTIMNHYIHSLFTGMVTTQKSNFWWIWEATADQILSRGRLMPLVVQPPRSANWPKSYCQKFSRMRPDWDRSVRYPEPIMASYDHFLSNRFKQPMSLAAAFQKWARHFTHEVLYEHETKLWLWKQSACVWKLPETLAEAEHFPPTGAEARRKRSGKSIVWLHSPEEVFQFW